MGSLKSTSASSMASEDSLDASNFPDYEDLVFVKNLSEAKFPVYLVEDSKTEHQYAMKVFQWEKDSPSLFFMREVRFAQIESPNVIQFINYEFEKEHQTESGVVKFSYILMEYAPYGDFFDVLITAQVPFDETLIRTYFHQLVKAIEDVHSQGAAHLDIKLENLLMNRDFKLKLTDFDLGCMGKEEKVKTKGTKNFRAPEVLNGTCNNPQAADIFSMGVLLFILRTGGMIPYNEDQSAKCLTFEEFKKTNPKTFWEKQCIILKKSASFFSEDFKSLFIWMTRPEPEERPSLAQIKRSKWYRREIYSEEEVAMFMQNRLEPKE